MIVYLKCLRCFQGDVEISEPGYGVNWRLWFWLRGCL